MKIFFYDQNDKQILYPVQTAVSVVAESSADVGYLATNMVAVDSICAIINLPEPLTLERVT